MRTIKDCNRVEVISVDNGREFVKYDLKEVRISFQDKGKTIKLFIK